MGRDEAGTLARLKVLRRELIDPEITEHKGRIVKTTGDGILIEFPSVVEAVACAIAVQRSMVERNAATPQDQRIEFRVGINSGDVIVEDGDIHGNGVNVAARLEALAEPGGVCISAIVHDQVEGRLDCDFEDLGEPELKNIDRRVRVYRVLSEQGRPPPAAPPPLPDKPALAVLPFQNMSGDPEQEYFADGIVEEITTAISRFPSLSIVARNSAFAYKGKTIDVKQVGRDLGVRYVLEGSIRKAGNRVRITSQLINALTGAHIWADRFDGTLDDIFELQDQVASGVVGAIEPRLHSAEIERASRKPTESLDAYDFYLRAMAEFYKRTTEGHAEAVRLLQQALALDPTYAPAMGRIAVCRLMQLARHWIPAAGPEVEEGIRMARQAVAAARENPEVLQTAGYALSYLAGENETALSALDRAIALNPNSANAFGLRALVLGWLNRPDEAILSAQQAIRLSPQHPYEFVFHTALAAAYLALDRHEEALPWADSALRENSGAVSLRLKLSLCGHLGRSEEARECLRLIRDLHPEPTIAGMMGDLPKGMQRAVLAKLVEGWRKAGLPEG